MFIVDRIIIQVIEEYGTMQDDDIDISHNSELQSNFYPQGTELMHWDVKFRLLVSGIVLTDLAIVALAVYAIVQWMKR